MAITKTLFRNDDLALQAPEVLAWLQQNGEAYFDNIEYDDTNKKIICSIDAVTAFEVFFAGQYAVKTSLNNGVYKSSIRGVGTIGLFNYGIATNSGLVLVYTNEYTSTSYAKTNCVVITKDNNGDVTFIIMGQTDTSTTGFHLWSGTFTKYTFNDWYGGKSAVDLFTDGVISVQAATTALIPFTDKTYPIYTPAAYLLVFNQYFRQEGTFTIDGTDYYTTGFIALSD